MDGPEVLLILVPLLLVVGALAWWQFARADAILDQWARAERMEIVSAEKRYLRTGPFFFRHSRGQFVFRIVVRDHTGATRSGWLRVGSLVAGVLSNQATVIWDP